MKFQNCLFFEENNILVFLGTRMKTTTVPEIPWLSLYSLHLGSGVVYVLIYVYVQILCFFFFCFFFCLLVLISVLWMRVRWSGNSLGCFNNFIHVHVAIFFVLHYSSGVVGGGGEWGTFVVIRGRGCSEEASCLEL